MTAGSGSYGTTNGPYVIGTSGVAGGSGSGQTVWITPSPTTTSTPYVVTTTGSSYGTVGVSSTWTDTTVCCKFCDKQVEIGLVIQSKGKSLTHVCVKCAKELMGGEKVKELLDLIESLATMAEVAKS